MDKLYLITGATGHVGTVLVGELLKRGCLVRALVLPGEGDQLPHGVEFVEGDITDLSSLAPFFDRDGHDALVLIHCAARITVASRHDPLVWKVNVDGTENVMHMAFCSGVERVIYVSSVHAIPEKPEPHTITEVDRFSPELVHGQYAKSKAAAAQIALDYAQRGLNVSIVHPSGIIGPGDTRRRNHMIRTIHAMAEGSIPVALHGGYDFVDSRDVVTGILACEEKGRRGECYILSGQYITVLELLNLIRLLKGRKRRQKAAVPHGIARMIAPVTEWLACRFGKQPPLFTPYSVYTLHTNGVFSHEKATRELGYAPREIEASIRDSLS